MKHPQAVTYVTPDGVSHTEVFYCGTGQQAMKECRFKHRDAEITGAGRLFTKSVDSI